VVSTPTPTSTATATPTATPTAAPDGAKITAPKALTLAPAGIGINQTTKGTFVIRNAGKPGNLVGNLAVSQLTTTFTVSPSTFNLAPKATQSVMVTFTPDATLDTGSIVINSNDLIHGTLNVKLSGRGFPGQLAAPANFAMSGPTGAGTVTANLTIRNTGRGLLVVSFPSLIATPISPYAVSGNTLALQPGTSKGIPISFTPNTKGRAPSASLTISAASPSSGGRTVTLQGTGK
jgi:hypothetical protein